MASLALIILINHVKAAARGRLICTGLSRHSYLPPRQSVEGLRRSDETSVPSSGAGEAAAERSNCESDPR